MNIPVTRLLQDGTIIEEIPQQNRCADIWRLVNPETEQPYDPNRDEPKQWIHTDY
jgi:hypothetical protein